MPVIIDPAGDGMPVVDATVTGIGIPMTVSTNGIGTPITISTNGIGTPGVFNPPLGPDTTAPQITSAASLNNPTDTTLSHTLVALDVSPVTWTIVGGADAADFELSGTTLRWAGNVTRDYDNPVDADTNNTYIVTVRATDSQSNYSEQTITVTVIDVPTPPDNTVAPVIADTTPTVGETLTCTSGTWTGTPTIMLMYQWFYYTGMSGGHPDGTPIPGATTPSYGPLTGDGGGGTVETGKATGLLLSLTKP